MAKKEITVQFKLQAPGGTATPAPPIGPALGQHGVNPGQFIQKFNAMSAHLKDAVKAEKVSGEPNKNKIGKVTMAQCKAIAKEKGKDLNAFDEDHAARIIA